MDLLYSTGNYVQYFLITILEKESEKYIPVCVYIHVYTYVCVYVCVCVYKKTESLCYVPETNTLEIKYTSIKKELYKKYTTKEVM